MGTIEVVQVAFVHPMISALQDAGAPVQRHLRTSKLDLFSLHDLDSFVPAACVHDFFNAVADHETGPDIPREILANYRLENMGNWGAYVATFPDILSAILAAVDPAARNLSTENMALITQGARSTLRDEFNIAPSIGRTWIELLTAHIMLDGMRLAGGKHWMPREIHLGGSSASGLEDLLPSSDVEFCYGRPSVAFVFPTEFLASPLSSGNGERSDWQPNGVDMMVSSRLELILDASTDDFRPNLDLMAELADTSPRTVQRRLADEGTNFGELIDQWRFKRALQLLNEPALSVREIGQQLRYAHTPHFVRAFNRWTGTSPQRYRDELPLMS